MSVTGLGLALCGIMRCVTPTAPPPFVVQTFEVQTFEAQTPEQARLLLDLSYFRTLEAVMRGEVSAGEVARARWRGRRRSPSSRRTTA